MFPPSTCTCHLPNANDPQLKSLLKKRSLPFSRLTGVIAEVYGSTFSNSRGHDGIRGPRSTRGAGGKSKVSKSVVATDNPASLLEPAKRSAYGVGSPKPKRNVRLSC